MSVEHLKKLQGCTSIYTRLQSHRSEDTFDIFLQGLHENASQEKFSSM